MRIIKATVTIFCLSLLSLSAMAEPIKINWSDLIPPEYREDTIALIKSTLNPYIHKDGEVAPQRVNEQLKSTVDALAERNVIIQGYMVPIDMDADGVITLLLAPYAGACIHVPPPPPNQLIYIELEKGQVIPWEMYWSPITIQGSIEIEVIEGEYIEGDIALTGYTMKDASFVKK
ncbi:DUF3299 domain-containing protein [Vibrio ulleungensis]|uniref:DUF3299 domain-containing protein n=1 Tax=Vibrio ulleungensis TaxID=2807619 RepID=A0ABS2HGV3_9VIBR|nr:DUF3299 domain-containing protein [Vibrio ulleungensis]MBM7036775.1 DUF3299 domain-containing protein [Vibrio ulleungensis]